MRGDFQPPACNYHKWPFNEASCRPRPSGDRLGIKQRCPIRSSAARYLCSRVRPRARSNEPAAINSLSVGFAGQAYARSPALREAASISSNDARFRSVIADPELHARGVQIRGPVGPSPHRHRVPTLRILRTTPKRTSDVAPLFCDTHDHGSFALRARRRSLHGWD
jgi:hypothetical protein